MIITHLNWISTTLFLLAICHTLLSPLLHHRAISLARLERRDRAHWKFYHFASEILFLLGEVEVIFGIWLIPLFIWYGINVGWGDLLHYLNAIDFTNPLYIMVIVVVVGTRPIISFIEKLLEWVARMGGDTPGAWWWTILTIAPLFGSLIKEPGAMAIAAILLAKKFYLYNPSFLFRYATLALLFVNVSVGALLTSFSSVSLFVLARKWEYTLWTTFFKIGWKAVIGIVLSNLLYYLIFRREFKQEHFPKQVPTLEPEEIETPTPFWMTLIHLLFMFGVVYTGAHAPLFLAIFLLFLGFHRATNFYQDRLHLRRAALLGFFFASLIIHGDLQGWWLAPLIEKLSPFPTLMVTALLSTFVDNATVSHIVANIPPLSSLDQYLVIAGLMASGGLTVVASASNPIGISLLRPSFFGRISFTALFIAALIPTAILLALFWFLRTIPAL